MLPTCNAMISPGRFHVDPEPPEYCDAEVAEEGDRCPEHAEADREPDYDTMRKEG